jgi:predicted nuclease with TOPRIM domain
MQEQLQKRLQSLKTEYEAGQQVLANLEAKKSILRETLIRISGAIEVLEEELAIVTESGNEQHTEPLAKEE